MKDAWDAEDDDVKDEWDASDEEEEKESGSLFVSL